MYTIEHKKRTQNRTVKNVLVIHVLLIFRQLLWHGSRLTNWVGILSQGLRIAPPEAPVTGYMVGHGFLTYFYRKR